MSAARVGEPRLPYLPALDGVRAIAVVAVLLFHGGVPWAGGGFLGVDVFFALSGFLITSLLLHEVQVAGTLRLRAFWARRARRLLPALVAVVIAVCVYGRELAAVDVRERLAGDAVAALAYVANWHFAFTGTGYFDRTALPSPLQHTWSLGIEEQFYVVWPLVVLLIAVVWRRRAALAAVCVAGAVASTAWMLALRHDGASVNRLYYGTDTRAVALLCGAALAAVALRATERAGDRNTRLPAWRGSSRSAVGVVALACVMALCVVARDDSRWLYPWGFTGVALATTALVAALVTHPDGALSRALSLPPLVAVGRVSYGVYLWHWPIFQVLDGARTGLTGGALLAVRLAATGAVSVASYALVEQPMRRRGGVVRGRLQLGAATAALATVTAFVVALGQSGAVHLPGETTAVAHADVVAGVGSSPAPAETRPAGAVPAVPRRLLVLGDSVAMSLAAGVRPYFRQHGHDVIDGGRLGCGIADGSPFRYFGNVTDEPEICTGWPEQWHQMLLNYRPEVVLLLVGRWEVMDRMHDGAWTHVGEPGYDAYLGSQLDRAFDVMGATGARVAAVTAPYYRRGERPDGGLWPEDETWRVDSWNTVLRAALARHPQVRLVDLNAKMSPDGGFESSVDGILLREDGVHLTSDAGWWLAPWLLDQLNP